MIATAATSTSRRGTGPAGCLSMMKNSIEGRSRHPWDSLNRPSSRPVLKISSAVSRSTCSTGQRRVLPAGLAPRASRTRRNRDDRARRVAEAVMTGGTQQDSAETHVLTGADHRQAECLDASTSIFPLLPLANSSDQSSFGAISRKIFVIAALFVCSSSPSSTRTRSSTTSGLPSARTPVGQSETYTPTFRPGAWPRQRRVGAVIGALSPCRFRTTRRR